MVSGLAWGSATIARVPTVSSIVAYSDAFIDNINM
jgi:hypothetical protein